MLASSRLNGRKTWIEIDRAATAHNVRIFRLALQHSNILQNVGMLQRATAPRLWAVVKSNAYGHGLILFSKLLDSLPARRSPGGGGKIDGFCVDSVIEGLKLRQNGIRKPILVLGPTLGLDAVKAAKQGNLTLSVSSPEGLALIRKSRHKPFFHLKIDTGMHRQGIIPAEISNIKYQISKLRSSLTGTYTHFAMPQNRSFTARQFGEFQKAVAALQNSGFKNVIRHASATGGAIADPKYHLDAVRIGTGLQGILPNGNSKADLDSRWSLPPDQVGGRLSSGIGGGNDKRLKLQSVLSWHALVSEVKLVSKGEYVGYDCIERLMRNTKIAVIPIGYWHGYDRGLSGKGEVLIRGRRARIVGRVSMDLIVTDATGIPVRVGDTATLIGRQGNEEITAAELAERCGTSHYEILTRLNPLIERVMSN